MKALRLFWATLREIFDEAAYDRFLHSRQLTSSRDSYQCFLQERRSAQERKPRCC
jgi:hypothetical protein